MASIFRRQVRAVGVLALLAAPPYLLATGGTVPISQLAICQPCPQPSPKRWDFNGDGYRDLVVGVPYESVGGQISAGAVQVLYGGTNGISAAANQFFSHLTWPKTGDGLAGSGLGSGDFNGDGYADLAVGAPDHSPSPSGLPKTGIVDVMYGSSAGLIGWKHQVWDSLSDPDWTDSKGFDSFGAALAAADFNDDGYDDLAIGVPGGTGGYVIVLDGSAAGLTSSGSDVWTQDTAGIPGVAEDFDQFGAVLIAGNFGNGPADDLAIGAPGYRLRNLGRKSDAGLCKNVKLFARLHSQVIPISLKPIDLAPRHLAGSFFASAARHDGRCGL